MTKNIGGAILFYRGGRVWSLVGAVVLVISIVCFFYCLGKTSEARIGLFFATLPLWVMAVMLGKHFFRPVPVLIAEPERIMFCTTKAFGNPWVEILWGDIAEIRHESTSHHGRVTPIYRPRMTISAPQELLIFRLKNGSSYEFSLLSFEHEDEDLLSQIFREHSLTVKQN